MQRKRAGILAGVAVIAAAGLGAGVAIAATSGSTPAQTTKVATSPAGPGYAYYRSMMGQYFSGSSIMGGTGGNGWVMGAAGYRWMFGGTSAPAWMRGQRLPAAMMGTGADPGLVMGRLWANAPGPRVSPGQAARYGDQVPAGARINRAAHTITFAAASVHLAAVASPARGQDETFRIVGMVTPAIIVPAGARVGIEVVNADPDTSHRLVITASSGRPSWMPMMTDQPAFRGSALWFLGDPPPPGMHTFTLTFTAGQPRSYHYLCPVPGHAQKGMTGVFTIANAP